MRPQYLPFADWLKALGLTLIVWGHVAARTTPRWTPPVYPKQLGVTFFLFAAGFMLARERRPWIRVLYNRLFELFLVGLLVAVLMSIGSWFVRSDLNESNYLPFFGLQLLNRDFPANPTTWYIGTYLHLLILWALLLRRMQVTRGILAAVLVAEVLIRAVLIRAAGGFVAYMALSNWLTVLLLGLAAGQQNPAVEPVRARQASWLALPMLVWPFAVAMVPWRHTFPFMSLDAAGPVGGTMIVAVASSLVYIGFTLAAYGVARQLRANSFVQFLARNTLVVFVAHMPLYYVLEYFLRPAVPSYALRVAIEFVILLPGLALLSEQLHRVVPVVVIRERVARWIEHAFGHESALTLPR